MHDLYEGVELNEQQTEVICLGLLDLAAVDGTHASELELVEGFYSNAGGTNFSALQGKPFELAKAVEVLSAGGEPAIEAFLVSAYLLIYADGEHSDAERIRIGEFAAAFGVAGEALEALHLKARLYLLQMLAQGLKNKDVVRQVGASLGLAEDQMTEAFKD